MMVAVLALMVFMPQSRTIAIEKQNIETLECDVINLVVNLEITKDENPLMFVEVEISPGDYLMGVNQEKNNDNDRTINSFCALFDNDDNSIEDRWYCTSNYLMYSLDQDNYNVSSEQNIQIAIMQNTSEEVIGILPKHNKNCILYNINNPVNIYC